MTRGKHLLMTADAVGGVWTYASSLATELASRGWRITIITLGPAPRQDQIVALLKNPQIDLELTHLKLEWQDPAGDDRSRVLDFLRSAEDRLQPDVVHLNGYREALAGWSAPTVVVAHSCVGSWWQACRADSIGADWNAYLADIASGLACADRWVAPTAAFRDVMEQLYDLPRAGEVIWNGLTAREPKLREREPFILAAGRPWDEAKNLTVLADLAPGLHWPVRIAGSYSDANGQEPAKAGANWLGTIPNAGLRDLMGEAGIFVAPAVYEPFGLTVLEAAFSGCALVLADIPTLRELWHGAALFVNPRDPMAVRDTLNTLAQDDVLRRGLQARAEARAARYTLSAMADRYEQLYRSLLTLPMPRTFLSTTPSPEAWR
jgi:glycosyltransferase involved in cell wall biosynthesis